MEVFVTEGGEHIRDMFNAIAAFCGSGPFDSLLRLLVLAGMLMAAMHLLLQQSGTLLIKWAVVFTGILGLTLVPKSNVIIVDKSNPGLTGNVVANVPIGLAYLASLSTTMGHTITSQFETVMSVPMTVSYSENGMLWGHSLVAKMPTLTMTSAVDQRNVNEYLKSCVFPAAAANPVEVQNITSNTDLWAYFNGGASTNRLVSYTDTSGNGSMVTCNTAAGAIDSDLNTAVDDGLQYYGKRLYSDLSDSAAKSALEGDLSVAHNQFLGVSRSGADALKQLFVINQVKSGMSAFAADAGASDLMNYVNARAETQSRVTMASIGRLMQTAIPRMYSILLITLIAIFPIVLALSMLPGAGFSIIKNYAFSFVYLQFWPLLFVIFNRIIQVETANQAAAAASSVAGGVSGLSLDTIGPLASIPNETAAMAGVFMSLVPVLAGIFTKGVSVLGGQMESVLRPVHVGAESAAAEATTGNLNIGNTSMNTHGYNSVQGNSINTSGNVDTGAFQTVSDTGAIVGNKRDGTAFADANPAISNMMLSPKSTSGVEQSLSNRRSQAVQQRSSAQESMAESSSRSNTALMGLMAAERSGLDISSAVGGENAQSVSESLSSSSDNLRSIAEANNVNWNDMMSVSAGAYAKAGASTGMMKAFGVDAGAGVTANADTSASMQRANEFMQSDTWQEALRQDKGLNQLKRAYSGNTETNSFANQNEFTRGLNDSVNDTTSAQSQISQATDKISGIDEASNYVKSQGNQVVANLGQMQMDNLTATYGESTAKDIAGTTSMQKGDPWGSFAASAQLAAGESAQEQYVNQILGGEMVSQDYASTPPPEMPSIYNPEGAKEGYGENAGAWRSEARESTSQYRGSRPSGAENNRNMITGAHTDVAQETIAREGGVSGFYGGNGYYHAGENIPKNYGIVSAETDIRRDDTQAKKKLGGFGDDPLKPPELGAGGQQTEGPEINYRGLGASGF